MIALGDKGGIMGRVAVLFGVVFAFLSAAVWWLESRFGAGVAITVIGAILGVSALGIGYVLAMTSNRQALNSAASIYHSAAHADAARAGALRDAVKYAGQIDVLRERAALQDARRALPGPVAPAQADDWEDFSAWDHEYGADIRLPPAERGGSLPFLADAYVALDRGGAVGQGTGRDGRQFRIKFLE